MVTTPPSLLIPLPVEVDPFRSRLSRKNGHILTKFLKILIHNSTVSFCFETYTENIYTIPLFREHHDSYLYYIDNHSITSTPDEIPFLYLSPPLSTLLISIVKTFTPPISTFPSVITSQLFSKTFR